MQIGLDERTMDHVTISRMPRLMDEATPRRRLADTAGLEATDEVALRRMDGRRKKKGSNEEWVKPPDPKAHIMRLMNGRTALT